MGRIFNYLGVVIDLGNIKHIEEKYADTCNGYPCDWYVQIELLNGNEYVLNSSTGETELIKPVIEIKCSDGSVSTVVKEISEQWEKYLESKEIHKTKEYQEDIVGVFREPCEEDGRLSYFFENITEEDYNMVVNQKPSLEAAFRVSSSPFTGAEKVEWQLTEGQIIYADGVVTNKAAPQVINDVVSDMIVEYAASRKIDVLRIKVENQSLVSVSLLECNIELIESDADYVYFEVDVAAEATSL